MSLEKTIVSVPINLPKLEPDDWDRWWDIWKKYATPLKKTGVSPNQESGLHTGFDVFKIEKFSPVYKADYLDLKNIYPTLYDQIMALPVFLYGARFVLSGGDFPAHIDNFSPNWSIRSMFFCEDPVPQWYYTKTDNTGGRYLRLPKTTNWWAYRDGIIKHGTIFRKEYPKIILQVFSDKETTDEFIKTQINLFPDHQIEYDIG